MDLSDQTAVPTDPSSETKEERVHPADDHPPLRASPRARRGRTPASAAAPASRGRRIVLAFAVALVAVGGAAGAAGLIPDDVQRALGLADRGDPALAPNVGEATRRTSTAAGDGGLIELWTAPTKGGGTCAYLRHLDAAGKPADGGAVTCRNVVGGGLVMGSVTAIAGGGSSPANGAAVTIGGGGDDSPLDVQIQQDTHGGIVAYGRAPADAARLVITDEAGIRRTATPTADGWFVLVLPDARDPTALQSIEAVSASGSVLAHIPLGAGAKGDLVESKVGSAPGQTTPGG